MLESVIKLGVYDTKHFMERAYEAGHKNGRASMKADILAMLNTCLDRDPTLQKLVKQIEDMQ